MEQAKLKGLPDGTESVVVTDKSPFKDQPVSVYPAGVVQVNVPPAKLSGMATTPPAPTWFRAIEPPVPATLTVHPVGTVTTCALLNIAPNSTNAIDKKVFLIMFFKYKSYYFS